VLTLGNGQRVFLDSMGNGGQMTQGSVTVVKQKNGEIVYQGKSINPDQLVYNELTVPRGSRIISLLLTDGTKVWLNAASSLRYPVVFAGSDRTVEITGEAYFEVAKDASRPFHVSVKGRAAATQIDVLGTSFNINAYADEPLVKATLVEGKIRVGQNGYSGLLEPGQQARTSEKMGTTTQNISIVDHANIQQVLAWKNGSFSFDEADLASVMRELSRWYDVEVEFKESSSGKKFGGEIPRNSSLSQALEMLMISGIRFQIIGKKVIVLP
jgi:ferric-dicitrate binding protein FerR (iron transport regulator)